MYVYPKKFFVEYHTLNPAWFDSTLQELKLQGIKIRDGVGFSRYSRAQWFGTNLSDFGKVPKCLCSSIGRASDL